MKSILVKLVFVLTLSVVFVACVNKNDGIIDIQPEFLDISLSGTAPKVLPFTTDGAWYVRVDYAGSSSVKWLDVSPMSGKAGDNSIIIQSVSPNYTGVERHVVVNILIPGGESVGIQVVQQAAAKPNKLIELNRAMMDGSLVGPAQITLEYDKEDNVKAFTAEKIHYELVRDGNKGTVKFTVDGQESSFGITLLDEYISSVGPLTWTFIDPNTGITLRKSDVTIDFRYDSGENKHLRTIRRREVVSIDNATTLTPVRTEEELYTYTTEQLRLVRMERILPHDVSKKEAEFPRDTLIYTFAYPSSDNLFEENNVTANVWDLVVFPDNQGTPFYSLTGYWILGLTGVAQNSFPESIDVETRLHSTTANPALWVRRYVYSFQRNADNVIEKSIVNMEFDGSGLSSNGVMSFTYATPE